MHICNSITSTVKSRRYICYRSHHEFLLKDGTLWEKKYNIYGIYSHVGRVLQVLPFPMITLFSSLLAASYNTLFSFFKKIFTFFYLSLCSFFFFVYLFGFVSCFGQMHGPFYFPLNAISIMLCPRTNLFLPNYASLNIYAMES